MNSLLSQLPGIPAWFVTLLDLSCQAALLTGIVFVIIKILGRWIPPHWRALLWFVVILRVMIPFSPPSPLSLQNLFVKSEPTAVAVRTPVATPAITSQTAISFAPQVESPPINIQPRPAPFPTGRAFAITWSLIAALALLFLAARAMIIRLRLARTGTQPAPFILEMLAACRKALRLRYPVRAIVSNEIAAPAITGLIPARLIFPRSFGSDDFAPAQLRQILLHELAHIQLGHLLLHWLTLIARAVHWFNPAIHFAAIRLRQECELAADAAALRDSTPADRAAYGETLLQVLAKTAAPASSFALGMAEQRRHLEQRLRALAEPSPHSFRLLGAVVAILLTLSGLSSAVESPRPEQALLPPPNAGPQPAAIIRLEARSIEGPPGTILALLQKIGAELPSASPATKWQSFVLNAAQTDTLTNLIAASAGLDAKAHVVQIDPNHKSQISFADEPPLSDWPQGSEAAPLAEVTSEPMTETGEIVLHSQVLMTTFEGRTTEANQTLPLFRVRSTKSDLPIALDASQVFYLSPRKRAVPASLQDFDPLSPTPGSPNKIVEWESLILLTPKTGPLPTSPPQATQSATRIKDARLLVQMGKTNEAERKLRESSVAPREEQAVARLSGREARKSIEETRTQSTINDVYAPIVKSQDRLTDIESTWNQPTKENAAIIQDVRKGGGDTRLEIGSSVQDARLLIELGKLAEAETKLKEALKINPEDRAAHYYMSVLAEARPELGRPYVKTNQTSAPRKAIYQKLETIRIDAFPVASERPLKEILAELSDEVKKRDPSGKGVNLLIAPTSSTSGVPPIEVEKFKIKFDPPIRNVTLRHFLDALVFVAKSPDPARPNAGIRYSVEDYAIVFSQKNPDEMQYFTRVFKLDPTSFRKGLARVNSAPGRGLLQQDPGGFFAFTQPETTANPFVPVPAETSSIQNEVRAYFASAGLEFPTNSPGVASAPPKAFFYNENTGQLFVRTTLRDLDIIETALHQLTSPPKILFQSQIFDVTADEASSLIRNFTGARGIQTTNEYLLAAPSTNQTPIQLRWSKEIVAKLKDPVIAHQIVTDSTEFILPHERAEELRKRISQKSLGDQKVTTLLGNPAIISITEAKTVVTASFEKNGGAQLELGRTTYFEPQRLDADGAQYSADFMVTDFLGYAGSENDIPYPRVRVRSTKTLTKVPLGSTQLLVIPQQEFQRLPVLSDLPLLGRLFESPANLKEARRYIVLITPTVIAQ